MGRFAGLLSTIKTASLLGIVTNFREIGTAIGEGAAKLMGYGKVLEEAEIRQRADAQAARDAAAAKAEYAQKLQLAAEKALGLNDASRKMVAEFNDVVTKGGSVVDALDKVSKALELGDLTGIANAGAALDALAQKGAITGQQVRDSLAAALKGVDLGVFETQARAAFDSTEQGARRLAAAIDAVATESLRRAGTSVEELKTGFSAAANSAINDFDRVAKTLRDLGATGADASRALVTALDKASATATTERAAQAVISRWQELGRQGLVTGDQLAAGLDKARSRLDALVPGVNSVEEAFRTLGLRGPQELNRVADASREAWQRIKTDGTVALQAKIEAFSRYREAAIAANGGVESSEIALQRRMLEAQAAASGLGDSIEGAMRRGTKATNDQSQAVEGLTDSWERAADSAARRQAQINGTKTAGAIGNDSSLSPTDNTWAPKPGDIIGSYELDAFSTLQQKKKYGTLSADDLKVAEAAYMAAQSDAETMNAVMTMNAGAYSLNGQRDVDIRARVSRDLLEEVWALANPVSSQGAQGRGQAGGYAGGGTSTVNINLGGQTRTVNTDAAGAAALQDVLRQLEQSAGRSGP